MLLKMLKGGTSREKILHDKTGFTLMELIIVMAIIAILVTLAILYYGNVTDEAYRNALLADLNAADKAIALYEKQYNALPMVQTTAFDLDTVTGTNANVPAILREANFVNVYTVDRANANFLGYIRKTTYLFKGHDAGDVRGAGMLYYVDSVNSIRTGAAQGDGGTDNQIVLNAGSSDVNDYYNNCVIYITSGNAAGQSRTITDYVGGSLTATVSSNWLDGKHPAVGDTFDIRPPVKKGDLVFVQSAVTDRLIIKDENNIAVYKY